jgi:hypothetical protein
MKNLLKGFVKFPIFLLILLFFFFKSPVMAEEKVTVDWSDDVFTNVDNIDTENNVVLFVGDNCDACDALVVSIQDFNLDEYYDIQLVDGHKDDSKEYMITRLEEEGFSTDPLYVPVLVHKDFTTQGYLSCNAYLQSLDRLKENEDWLATVKQVATEIYEEEQSEIESQTLLELIPKLDWWVFVAVGLGVMALIVVLIVFLKKRKSLGKRGQILVTVGQIGFSALLVVFLVIMANSKKQYIPEVSLAGCVDGVGCDSWAELVAWRAQSADTSTSEGRKAVRTAEKTLGDDWKDVKVGDTRLDSKDSESQVLRDAYASVVEGLENKEKAASLAGKAVDSLDDCDGITDEDKKNECKRSFSAYQSVASPARYLEIQLAKILGPDYRMPLLMNVKV